MKIVLVKPRYFDRTKRSCFTACIPPIGLTSLASTLLSRGYDVSILDMEALCMDEEGFYDYLKNNNPDVVGIDVRTPLICKAKKIANIVKKYSRDIKVIIGGPHLFIKPQNALEMVKDADFGLRGECELTLPELISGISSGKPLKDLQEIKGICLRYNDNDLFISSEVPLVEDLDSLSMPAHHLLPIDKYFDHLIRRKRYYSIITTRGCSHRCIFCAESLLYGRKIRERSVANVLDEIEVLIKKYNVNSISFVDATFNYSKERVASLCRGIMRRGLKFDWRIKARVNSVDYEMLYLMRKAGCRLISYGVEAASDKTLVYLKKDYTLKDVHYAFKLTKKAGIDIFGYFLLGSFNETKKDCLETIKFAKKINPLYAQFMYPLPLPGTELYQNLQEKKLLKDDWSNYYFYRTNYIHPRLHENELKALYYRAYASFYFRFSYLLKQLNNTYSFHDLIRKLRTGVVALFYIIKDRLF